MKPGRKRSLTRKIIYILGSLLIVIAISSWIFFTYYFEDSVNDFLTPKLQEVIRAATNGRFELTIGRIIRKDGMLYCTNFKLQRLFFDSTESGMTLERLTADTVFLKGLHGIYLLRGKGSFISRMEMHAPDILITEVPPWQGRAKNASPDTIPTRLPDDLPVLAFDSIILTDMRISLPKEYRPSGDDSVIRGVSARLADFRLDNETIVSEPLLYSKHAALIMPKLRFDIEEGEYAVEAGPIHAELADSLLTIDSVSLTSNLSEEEFAAKEKYTRGKMDVHCANVHIQGFDLERFTQGKRLALRRCTAGNWAVDYYSDKRKPRNPHPPEAIMPNELTQEFHLPVRIDSLILGDGKIKIRERAPGSKQAGVITFDRVKIGAYSYCTDTSFAGCGKPTKISISALFLGEAPVTAEILFDFQHPSLDLRIDATVGKFSAKKLNEFLIPNERKEVTDGTVEDGKLVMNINNGVATTTVTPHYHDLSMRILPEQADGTRGLLEGIKTFVANTFVLHSNNMDKTALTSKTTYRRKSEEEFLQFIWIALRRSLGKVIGGFD